MPGPESISTWGTVVLMLPFGLLLALAVFGADERLAAPKRRSLRVRFCEMGSDGQPEMADPDGVAWRLEPRSGTRRRRSNCPDSVGLKTVRSSKAMDSATY